MSTEKVTTEETSISLVGTVANNLVDLGLALASAERIILADELNSLEKREDVEEAIKESLTSLDAIGEFLALSRLADRIKKAVTRSNSGQGEKLKFLGEHGGKVEVSLKWQKNPKQCLGLKENGISFTYFSAETGTLEQQLKQVKEKLEESKVNPQKQIQESVSKIESMQESIKKLSEAERKALVVFLLAEYPSDFQTARKDAIRVRRNNLKAARIEKLRDHYTGKGKGKKTA